MTTILAWTACGWLVIAAALVAANCRARRNLAKARAARAVERPLRLVYRANQGDWQQLTTAIDLARRDFQEHP